MTISASETMIARIAPFRICWLKLAETFLTPTEVASRFEVSAAVRSVCSCCPSDGGLYPLHTFKLGPQENALATVRSVPP